MIAKRFRLRPDQVARLEQEENQSAAVRAALDQYFTVRSVNNVDHAAALDAMAKEPPELYEE